MSGTNMWYYFMYPKRKNVKCDNMPQMKGMRYQPFDKLNLNLILFIFLNVQDNLKYSQIINFMLLEQ